MTKADRSVKNVLAIGRLTHFHPGVDREGKNVSGDEDFSYELDDLIKPPVVAVDDGANVVSSLLTNGKHAPALDLDIPTLLLPSSTEGHHHLYIDHELTCLGADDYVFAEQGPFFVYKMFERRQWQAALKAAGYTLGDAPRFYDLRHTFATLHAEAGTPPHVLMYLLGHSNIKTTMNVYVHGGHGDPTTRATVERIYGGETAGLMR